TACTITILADCPVCSQLAWVENLLTLDAASKPPAGSAGGNAMLFANSGHSVAIASRTGRCAQHLRRVLYKRLIQSPVRTVYCRERVGTNRNMSANYREFVGAVARV